MKDGEPKFRNKTVSAVYGLIKEPVEKAGYTLWDVDFFKEGASYDLLVTIEKDGGDIDLDDCGKVSGILSPLLDEKDPIPQSYCLEVSSAGIERVLKYDFHLEKYLGKAVRASLFKPVDGTKKYEGTLLSYDDAAIVLETAEKGTVTLERQSVSKLISVYTE